MYILNKTFEDKVTIIVIIGEQIIQKQSANKRHLLINRQQYILIFCGICSTQHLTSNHNLDLTSIFNLRKQKAFKNTNIFNSFSHYLIETGKSVFSEFYVLISKIFHNKCKTFVKKMRKTLFLFHNQKIQSVNCYLKQKKCIEI